MALTGRHITGDETCPSGHVLAGCPGSSVPEAVPQGFHDTACPAYDQLRQLQTWSRFEADVNQRQLAEARRRLDDIPRWDPGAVFIALLRAMSDPDDYIDYAIESLRAETEYRRLSEKHGFSCDLTVLPT